MKRYLVAAMALMILCVAPSALADTTVKITLTGAGNNIMDGVYVGPYTATIAGVQGQQVICDDFSDESYIGSTWTAAVNTFADLSKTLWGAQILSHGGTMDQVTQLYNEAAFLATAMMSLPANQQGLYSFAIWAIFNPTDVQKAVTQTEWAAIVKLIGNAAAQKFSPGQFANVLIYTPVNCIVGHCPSQEFLLVQTPEGGAAIMYLLFAGVACMFAVRFRARRGLPTNA